MLCKLKNVFESPQSAGKCYKNYKRSLRPLPSRPDQYPYTTWRDQHPYPTCHTTGSAGHRAKPCNARHRVSSEGLQLWIGAAPVDIHVVLVTPAEVTQAKTQHVRVQRAYLVDCFAVCGGHQHAVVAPNRFCRRETVLLLHAGPDTVGQTRGGLKHQRLHTHSSMIYVASVIQHILRSQAARTA